MNEFTAHCAEARAKLRRHMDGRGLKEKDGWRIYEFTREVDGHIELVMRPIHTSLATPPDLECICRVNEAGSSSYDCRA